VSAQRNGPSQRVRTARIIAIVTGVLGAILAIVTPLLPVTQTTAELNWPQQGQLNAVQAPLVSYVPVELTASVPCSTIDALNRAPAQPVTADETRTEAVFNNPSVLLSTTPKQADKAVERGLFIRETGAPGDPADKRSIEVVVRNTAIVSATLAEIDAQHCSSIDVSATHSEVKATFVGMTDPATGGPLTGSTADNDHTQGDQRPQLTGIFTDLTGPAATQPGLSLHATIDDRYTTTPTVLRWIAIVLGIVLTLISLIALYRLDATDGRRHRRIFPARWWRLNPRDAFVIVTLIYWHFFGGNTSDDGYILSMARAAKHAGYMADYYRWYAAPETPFGWYYRSFGALAEITTASPFVRIPALLCGIMVWLILSHEVLPRLGRAATHRLVPWTAALVFIAAWLPFNNGLRPEPIICLGALLTWCSVERAIATGRILPAAAACILGAFSVAAGPTGVMSAAAIIAGARPMMLAINKRAHVLAEIAPLDKPSRSYRVSLLAVIAPVIAAGTLVIPVIFNSLTFAAFLDSTKMKQKLGPSLPWWDEISMYDSLFNQSADGSIGRRFATLVMLAGIVFVGAMLLRKGRIPGTAVGPTRRIVSIIFASLIFLMFIPTKFTHHIGVFAGLAPALAAIAAIAIGAGAMQVRRNRTLAVALLLAVAAFSFAGTNSYYFVSNWGVPWSGNQVTIGGVRVASLLLAGSAIALLVAGWHHFREPFRHPDSVETVKRERWWQQLRGAPLAVIAAIVVAFELITVIFGAIHQSGTYSVPAGNLASLRGDICQMADKVLVEPDPNAGMLQPVSAPMATALTGPATPAPGDEDAFGTVGFDPNGLPKSLSSPASADSLGVLAGAANEDPDVLNSNGAGTGGGELVRPGVNGSRAKLPFGLDPATTPVMGSYSTADQAPARLRSSWFRLPPKEPGQDVISIAAAGRFESSSVHLEYSTDPGTTDANFHAAGSVQMIDPGPSPSWRNLRIYRSSLPTDATAIRIAAVDNNLGVDSFIVLTPPRVPHLQTLEKLVGRTDPVQIDWTSGLAFPCQRPFNHRDGVAELPMWRITPGADLSAPVTAWMDASGGGPIGWQDVSLEATTIPSYLRNDAGRDWGTLQRLVPYQTTTLADLNVGEATRSGLWRPAPIRD